MSELRGGFKKEPRGRWSVSKGKEGGKWGEGGEYRDSKESRNACRSHLGQIAGLEVYFLRFQRKDGVKSSEGRRLEEKRDNTSRGT